jgi:hypothetical protein
VWIQGAFSAGKSIDWRSIRDQERASGRLYAVLVPLDGAAQALLEVDFHLVAKMLACEADIGQRMLDISGSLGRISYLSTVTGQLAKDFHVSFMVMREPVVRGSSRCDEDIDFWVGVKFVLDSLGGY